MKAAVFNFDEHAARLSVQRAMRKEFGVTSEHRDRANTRRMLRWFGVCAFGFAILGGMLIHMAVTK